MSGLLPASGDDWPIPAITRPYIPLGNRLGLRQFVPMTLICAACCALCP